MLPTGTVPTKNVRDHACVRLCVCVALCAWLRVQVDVLNVNTNQQCYFYYNGWLSTSEPPYKTEVELFPSDSDAPPTCRCARTC